MIQEIFRLRRHLKNAVVKHPSFPKSVVLKHTTFNALYKNRDKFRRINDSGNETVASVINEEVSEMLCEMYKGRWHRAEAEWYDCIAVMLRVLKMIKCKKMERINRIASHLRYRRMLEHTTFEQLKLPINNKKSK